MDNAAKPRGEAQHAILRDPILASFRAALEEIYGARLERVVLFGSRARGDAHGDSDYDIAVFFKALPDRWAELHQLADLRTSFLEETGAFFDAKPYPITSYQDTSALMYEIRRDGLAL
jgi:predicted nucleotidyltransferase